jgi:hypothetical protein
MMTAHKNLTFFHIKNFPPQSTYENSKIIDKGFRKKQLLLKKCHTSAQSRKWSQKVRVPAEDPPSNETHRSTLKFWTNANVRDRPATRIILESHLRLSLGKKTWLGSRLTKNVVRRSISMSHLASSTKILFWTLTLLPRSDSSVFW